MLDIEIGGIDERIIKVKDEKVIDVCKKYEKDLKELCFSDMNLQHINWTVMKIPGFIKENQQEKANRWLGFIQGVLWVKKVYTVREMGEDNREEK
jgi:hypothetical protein